MGMTGQSHGGYGSTFAACQHDDGMFRIPHPCLPPLHLIPIWQGRILVCQKYNLANSQICRSDVPTHTQITGLVYPPVCKHGCRGFQPEGPVLRCWTPVELGAITKTPKLIKRCLYSIITFVYAPS